MTQNELNEARANPDFLKYLQETESAAIETKDIEALYEVLDSLLILDLQEDRINLVYENILKISFEEVDKIVNSKKFLKLEGKELFYIRSFYEHGIEKWSYNDFDGAKQLLFVLSNIIEDELLQKSLKIHLTALSKEFDLDKFYEKQVHIDAICEDEKYGFFIVNYKFDIEEYLRANTSILEKEYEALKHLLD